MSVARRLPDRKILKDLQDTERYARSWAHQARPGMVLALVGDLGAGKTTFSKYFAKALGFKGLVSSPTFTLSHHYPARLPIYHIDCYRLDSTQGLIGAGLEAYLPSTDGVTLIEWADKFPQLLPQHTLNLAFEILDEDRRAVTYAKGQP